MPPPTPIPSSTERAASPPESAAPCADEERLEALRLDLPRRLDEIMATGGARLESLKAAFGAAWREFTAGIDQKHR